MATLIKQAETPVRTFNVNDKVAFTVWVPLQNIGTTAETKYGDIVKVNRKTVDVVDENGNTWRVGMDEVH